MSSRRRSSLPTVVAASALAALWSAAGPPARAQPSISHDPEDPPRPTDRRADTDRRAGAERGPGADRGPRSDGPDGKPGALVSAAVADAAERLRRDVLDAELTDELTVRQAARRLRAEEAVDRLAQSADQRGSPRWRDAGGREAGGCEVRLELPGAAVADALLAAAEKQGDPDLSPRRLAPGLGRLRRQTFAAVGVARATEAVRQPERPPDGAGPAGPAAPADATPGRRSDTDGRPVGNPPKLAPPATPRPPRLPGGPSRFAPDLPPRRGIPADAPAWATDQITVQGKAAGTGLRGARAAEAEALAQVRRRVDQLQLSPGLTVGEACKSDPRLDRAVNEALSRAQVESTSYDRQQVTVQMSMDLNVVWRQVSGTRR